MASVRRSALLRAGVVTAALVAVVTVASGALPLQCLGAGVVCGADGTLILAEEPAKAALPATFPPPSMSLRDAIAPATLNMQVSPKVARATATQDALISATFAVLSGPKI